MKNKYAIISWAKIQSVIKEKYAVIKLWLVIEEGLSVALTYKIRPKGWA